MTIERKVLAKMANATYSKNFEETKTDKDLSSWEVVYKKDISETSLRALVFKKGDEYVISYCGTEDPKDVKTDLEIAASTTLSQLKEARQLYDEYSKKSNKITITGHSLGGALAQLVGAEKGCETVAFNAPGVYHLLEDKTKSPTEYSNITNYSLANDALNIANIIMDYKQLGKIKIIPSNGENPKAAHSNFNALGNSATMPYENWYKENKIACRALEALGNTNNLRDKVSIFASLLNTSINSFDTIIKLIENKVGNSKKSDFNVGRNNSPRLRGGISNVENTPYEALFRSLGPENMFKDTKVLINGKKPTEDQWKSLAEGYDKELDGIQYLRNSDKMHDEEDGYWYTTKNGKHVFVPCR